jgi:3-dehydroquinate dehydratase/shikimate dehydrogenase
MLPKKSVQICVPVCERTFAALKEKAEVAARSGDLVELRLDGLDADQLAIADKEIDKWLPSLRRPVIVTLRPAEQGGPRPLPTKFRHEFIRKRTSADLLDIEPDLAELFSQQSTSGIDWTRTICSYHDFNGVPENLEETYESLARTQARVLKIAVRANDLIDCLPVFKLLDRARQEGREMIAVAMGISGLATRILGPARGAFLTYGAIAVNRGTAPGQITAADLENLFRIRSIGPNTQITGLAGKPVSHSLSPFIHNSGFSAAGVDAVYIPFEVEDISSFVRRMVHPSLRELDWNFRGLSVTAPHKTTVMDHLDWIDPAAREIGAVNTVVCDKQELRGYNTDGGALVQPLIEKLETLRGAKCAVLGAGGAARAALWMLKEQGAEITLYARDIAKGQAVASSFQVPLKHLTEAVLDGFDVVINATPLGTAGDRAGETPAVARQLSGVRLAYDLVYNPVETRFLCEARSAGCETIGGLAMLVAQAFEQFKLWTGVEPPKEVMRAAAINALNNGQ